MTRRVEVSVGFSSRASGACCLPTTCSIPVGFDALLSIKIQQRLAVIGTVGVDFVTVQPVAVGPGPGLPATQSRTYGVLTGPRYSVPLSHRMNAFGQVLVGSTHR